MTKRPLYAIIASTRTPSAPSRKARKVPISYDSPETTIGSWVVDPATDSRGVALRGAAHEMTQIPIERGFERVEVIVLEPRGHHKLHDIRIWDVKALPARRALRGLLD